MSENDPAKVSKIINNAQKQYSSGIYSLLKKEVIIKNFEDIPQIHIDNLLSLDIANYSFKECDARYIPTSFNTKKIGDFRIFAQNKNMIWKTLDQQIKLLSPAGIILTAPLFWQIEPLFHKTLRENNLPVASVPPENIPLAIETIKQIEIQGVVLNIQSYEKIKEKLSAVNFQKPLLFLNVVYGPDDPVNEIPSLLNTVVFKEVHLFPGFGILTQCFPLASSSSTYFHLSREYTWEISGKETLITSLEQNSVPLLRCKIPVKLKKGEKCICGEIMYEKY